jgi:hypothetical protein
MAVGVEIEARRAPNYGLGLVATLGLDLVAGPAVVVLVIGLVVALVLGAFIALAAGLLLVLGLLVLLDIGLALRLLLVAGLALRLLLVAGFALRLLLVAGFALRLLLVAGLALRFLLVAGLALRLLVEIGVRLGLFLLVELLGLLDIRLALGLVLVPVAFEILVLDPAGVGEPIADLAPYVAEPVRDAGHLAERRQRIEPAQLRRGDPGRGDECCPRGDSLDSAVAAPVRLVILALERRLDRRGKHTTHIDRHLFTPSLSIVGARRQSSCQEREPLFFRLEPDRLLLLLPFEDERPCAVVRLRPPLDEPRPSDELLLRLRPDADDFDLPDDEPRLRALDDDLPALDDERLLLTSPSSITPRQDPVSSSSISM